MSNNDSSNDDMRTPMNHLGLAAAALACAVLAPLHAAAADTQIARGKYLATFGGCGDCHTPGSFLGHPDTQRLLAGSDVGFAIPGLGVFVARNLTPDKETGIGSWTRAQIVTAITTGKRPDGRVLAPIMPWMDFKTLTKADANAIAAYLQSLPPVKNAVPGPFGPSEKVSSVLVFDILPAAVYNSLTPASAPPPAGAPPAGK
jgi:mono/diheme cytochrome c family protein